MCSRSRSSSAGLLRHGGAARRRTLLLMCALRQDVATDYSAKRLSPTRQPQRAFGDTASSMMDGVMMPERLAQTKNTRRRMNPHGYSRSYPPRQTTRLIHGRTATLGAMALCGVIGRLGPAHRGAHRSRSCRKDPHPHHTYSHSDRATRSAGKHRSDRSTTADLVGSAQESLGSSPTATRRSTYSGYAKPDFRNSRATHRLVPGSPRRSSQHCERRPRS